MVSIRIATGLASSASVRITRRFEAVDIRHLDVHQHDVWMASTNQVDGAAAISGLADDVAGPGCSWRIARKPARHEGLIVGDHDSNPLAALRLLFCEHGRNGSRP